MEVIKYGLVGDSSLYAKRKNKRKSYISTVLRDKYRFGDNLTEKIFPGGGVKDLCTFLQGGKVFDVLGISYFGNEHTEKRMNIDLHGPIWANVFDLLRQYVTTRVVFFIGGYAAKYKYSRVYDENLTCIKTWIQNEGFEVVEARQEMSQWELASDNLHFSVDCLEDLAAFWKRLLIPDTAKQQKQGVKRGRELSGEVPHISPAKKSRWLEVNAPEPRAKWLFSAPAPLKPAAVSARPRPKRPTSSSEDGWVSSDEWTKGQERAARLERDKKKLNDELAERRHEMLRKLGLLPSEPRRIPPRRI